MKSRISDRKNDLFYFLVAFACTVLVFCVFVGQGLFSDVVTFAKDGDADKLCYASFMKIRECIINGEGFVGVDSGTFNGATEFFLRANLPVLYFPFVVFSFISVFVSPRIMYLLLYAIHMFAGIYYFEKLAVKHFKVSKRTVVLISALYCYLLCMEAWYVSFYFITALVPMAMFFSLEYFYRKEWIAAIKLIVVLIFTVTSGYITVSFFSVLFVYIIAQLLYINKVGIESRFIVKEILRDIIPFFATGLIVLLYLLQMYEYISRTINAQTNLADIIFYKTSFRDFFAVLSSYSYISSSLTEGVNTFNLGIITCISLILAIKDNALKRVEREFRIYIISNICVWLIILIWSMEEATCLPAWLYSFLPVLGGMHIPNRYLMVTLPFFYISLGILFEKIEWEDNKKFTSITSIILLCLGLVYCFLANIGIQFDFLNGNHLFIEIVFSVIALQLMARSDGKNRLVSIGYLIWAISIIVPGITIFYSTNNVYARKEEITNRSIVYDEIAVKQIDNYIEMYGRKNSVNRLVSFDSEESVPSYLLTNYEWYNLSEYSLCNLSGYEIQLCVPEEYRRITPWFNSYDWRYVVDARTDFLLTDLKTIESEKQFYDTIIDWEKGYSDVGNGRVIVSLKKFIPSLVCGHQFVYEDRQSFDNGYFYSHELDFGNVDSFETDENTYYELAFKSDCVSHIVFLPYFNRNYKSYLDGEEIKMAIVNNQAYITTDPGEHTLRISYENTIGKVAVYMIISFELIFISIIIVDTIRSFVKKNNCKST